MPATDYVPQQALDAIGSWRDADASERAQRLKDVQNMVLGLGVRVSVARVWLQRHSAVMAAYEESGAGDGETLPPLIDEIQSGREPWLDAVPPRIDGAPSTATVRDIILSILTAPTEVPNPFGAT